MNAWLTLLTVGALLVPGVALAQASNISTSKRTIQNSENHLEVQLVRCDASASITGDSPVGGETCEAGDWSEALDCRNFTNLGATYFEYSAAGSSVVKIWDCLSLPGTTTTASSSGGTAPSVEAPGATPSAADPDPLCVDLTLGAGVTLNGTAAGTQLMNLSNQKLHFIVGEIDACTSCDSTLVVSCGR